MKNTTNGGFNWATGGSGTQDGLTNEGGSQDGITRSSTKGSGPHRVACSDTETI